MCVFYTHILEGKTVLFDINLDLFGPNCCSLEHVIA